MIRALFVLLLWWQLPDSSLRSSQGLSGDEKGSVHSLLCLVKMSKINTIKVLPPRPLASSETTHSLTQWKVNFRQYCKKDDNYKHFLVSTTRWDFSLPNAGFVTSVGSRTPETLKDDLEDFVLLLASYLPHGYLTDKLLSKSKSFDSAMAIIEDHYGLTSE